MRPLAIGEDLAAQAAVAEDVCSDYALMNVDSDPCYSKRCLQASVCANAQTLQEDSGQLRG